MQQNFLNREFFNNPEAAALPMPEESGRLPALVSGLSAIHRAHFMAALRKKTGRPLIVVSPDDAAADALAADLSALSGEPVNLLTAREFTFLSADAVSRQAEQKRVGALYALASGAPVTVVTVAGLLQRAMPPEALKRTAFTIREAAQLAPEDAEDALLRCGYVRAEQVEGPGQFSRRGGILDFFSPAYGAPVRVEFWGDDVDGMGFFDVSSQRRTERLDTCVVLPAAETLPSLYKGGASALAEKLAALAAQVEKHQNGGVTEKLAAKLREDADRMAGGAELGAADRYAGLIFGKTATPADYFPENAVVVLDQPSRTAERAKDYVKQVTDDVLMLVRSGTLAARAEDYVLPFDEAARRLSRHPLYLADAFTVGRQPVPPRAVVGITAKQLPSYGGSSETAAEDVAHYLGTGCRVVVLAGDMRRASILRDMFRQRDIRAEAEEAPSALPEPGVCLITGGRLSAGFEYPAQRLAVLTDTQIAGGGVKRAARRKKALAGEKIGSCADLSVGDLVVHEHHGIGRFAGVVRMQVDGNDKDYIKISYAGTDSLYVRRRSLTLFRNTSARARISPCTSQSWAARNGRRRRAAPKPPRRTSPGDSSRCMRSGRARWASPFRRIPRGRRNLRSASATRKRRTSSAASRRSRRIWKSPCRWTGSCAATWATARPRSPSAPP
jgi:transcription-repair coupling factor (superfamily II helicase)